MRNALALLLAASLLAACNINVQVPLSQSDQQAAATIVAQTMEAHGTSQASSPGSPQALATATSGGPATLLLTGNSNCRQGPGQNFKVVTAFTTGTSLEIVGRNAGNNFWQVKIPNSTDTCWIWGQYATVSGDIEAVLEVTVAPGAGGVPARPGSLFYDYTCDFGNLTTHLRWGDAADNEDGYRVYRFDILLADLPANSTTYTDVETVTPGSALQYSVEAYNSAGASAKRTISFKCE